MATLGTASAGAVAGAAITYNSPTYSIGTAVGWAIGSYVGSLIFKDNEKSKEGPRLDDLSVQMSTYGLPIPKIFGSARVAGNVIWSTNIKETKHKKEYGNDGKGGYSGSAYTTYTYSVSFAVAVCEGEIAGLGRIWMDDIIYLDLRKNVWDDEDPNNTYINLAITDERIEGITVYTGSETQTADPIIESHLGTGEVPAYRGTAYIVFEDLQLGQFGNRIPNVNFEIFVLGETSEENFFMPLAIKSRNSLTVDIYDNLITFTREQNSDPGTFTVYDRLSNRKIKEFGAPTCPFAWVDQYGTTKNVSIYFGSMIGEGQTTNEYDLIGMEILEDRYNPRRDNHLVTIWLGAALDINPNYPGHCFVVHHIGISQEVDYGVKSAYLGQYASGYATLVDEEIIFAKAYYEDRLIHIYENGTWIETIQLQGPPGINCTSNFSNLMLDFVRPVIHPDTKNMWLTNVSCEQYIRFIEYENVSATVLDYKVSDHPTGYAPGHGIAYSHYREKWVGWYSDNGGRIGLLDKNEFTLNKITYTKYDETYWPALDTVVKYLCNESGIANEYIDATDLENIKFAGYVKANTMAAKQAIEPLQMAYLFDIVEVDKKIKFVLRDNASSKTISSNDLMASKEDKNVDAQKITVANKSELPSCVKIKFMHPGRNYEVGTQSYSMEHFDYTNEFVMEIPIVMYNSEAIKMAQNILVSAHGNNKRNIFSLTNKHIDIIPTDVVTIDNVDFRITESNISANLMEFNSASQLQFSSTATTSENNFSPELPKTTEQTFGFLLDIPILDQANNTAGMYVVATGISDAWTGAVLFKSSDLETTWEQYQTIDEPCVIGYVEEKMSDHTTAVFDSKNELTVWLNYGSLSSSTKQNVLNGANAALIGEHGRWEVIQFVNATLNANGSYTIDTLLRGRLGTEMNTGNHKNGDHFILLDENSIANIQSQANEIGIEYAYKFVSFGGFIDSFATTYFTNTNIRMKPLAVCHERAIPDGNGTIDFSWHKRDRIYYENEWQDYGPSNLSIDYPQQFKVDVYSADKTEVLKTYELSSSSFSYTATMIRADFDGSLIYDMKFDISEANSYFTNGHIKTLDNIINWMPASQSACSIYGSDVTSVNNTFGRLSGNSLNNLSYFSSSEIYKAFDNNTGTYYYGLTRKYTEKYYNGIQIDFDDLKCIRKISLKTDYSIYGVIVQASCDNDFSGNQLTLYTMGEDWNSSGTKTITFDNYYGFLNYRMIFLTSPYEYHYYLYEVWMYECND